MHSYARTSKDNHKAWSWYRLATWYGGKDSTFCYIQHSQIAQMSCRATHKAKRRWLMGSGMCLPASLLIWRGCTEKACPAWSLKMTRPLRFQPTSKPMCRCVTQSVRLKLKQFLLLFYYHYYYYLFDLFIYFIYFVLWVYPRHCNTWWLSCIEPSTAVGSCHWYSRYLVTPQQDMRSCI